MTTNIKEFKIAVPQEKLDRLKKKLELTDWPRELEDATSEWQYGSPMSEIKQITEYWMNVFDWRAEEKKMNEWPQFETRITVDGFGPVDMHFLHARSHDVKGAIPLLFVHGWPGSFLEATKMLPYLLNGGEGGKPAFNLVAPSLPNYGFSGAVLKKGFGTTQYAEACHKVMLALGYEQYVVQGGDWGFVIVRTIARNYPDHCKAHHVNWCFAAPPQWTAENPEPEYSEREKRHLAQGRRWNPYGTGDGRGYFAIFSTRPATINYLLRDSPVGLLAWVYDKLHDWSDSYPWSSRPNEVCLWVSLYYLSRPGPDAASWIYYESSHPGPDVVSNDSRKTPQDYLDVPLGLADFPVEISNSPKSWWKTMGRIVWSKTYERGGHFAGWERPDDLAAGLCEMFGKGGGAFGVVDGKDGY